MRQLGSRSIEALVDLPPMTDPTCRAILDVLTAVEEPADFTDENLRCLVIARMVNLSLEHGNSDGSCIAYVQLGWFVGPRFGDYQAAFRFGKLGLDLVEKRGLERFRARVSQCFGYFVNPWSRHLRTSLELLRRSFATAQEAGDLKYAVYSCDRLVTFLLAAGDPLGDVQREAENGLEFARKAKFGYVVDIIIGQLRFIRTLRGLTPSFSSFNDAEFDEGQFEHHLEADPHLVFAACWYWIRKLQARFYAGDYPSALAAASKAEPLLQTAVRDILSRLNTFSMTRSRGQHSTTPHRPRSGPGIGRRSPPTTSISRPGRRIAPRISKIARHWSAPRSPASKAGNWTPSACMSRPSDRRAKTASLRTRALRTNLLRSSILPAAMRRAQTRIFETPATATSVGARSARCGSSINATRTCTRNEVPASSAATIGTPLEQLDLGTVVKASQAVSSEIVLGRLIETLMVIAVEHAGAERGLLILLRGRMNHGSRRKP